MKFIFMIFIFLNHAYAYDDESCKEKVFRKSVKNSTGEAGLISSISAGTVSSTQFISSWGPCSAIKKEEEKKEFIWVNLNPLMIDISRGKGEYMAAYAMLSNCSKNIEHISSVLKNNFNEIFNDDIDDSGKVYSRIENVLSKSRGCN